MIDYRPDISFFVGLRNAILLSIPVWIVGWFLLWLVVR